MHSNYSKIKDMARTNEIKHDLSFHPMILGPHKSLQYTPSKEHILHCYKDESAEAQSIDPDSIGVYFEDSIIEQTCRMAPKIFWRTHKISSSLMCVCSFVLIFLFGFM